MLLPFTFVYRVGDTDLSTTAYLPVATQTKPLTPAVTVSYHDDKKPDITAYHDGNGRYFIPKAELLPFIRLNAHPGGLTGRDTVLVDDGLQHPYYQRISPVRRDTSPPTHVRARKNKDTKLGKLKQCVAELYFYQGRLFQEIARPSLDYTRSLRNLTPHLDVDLAPARTRGYLFREIALGSLDDYLAILKEEKVAIKPVDFTMTIWDPSLMSAPPSTKTPTPE